MSEIPSVEVHNQEEFDAAMAHGDVPEVRGQAQVVQREGIAHYADSSRGEQHGGVGYYRDYSRGQQHGGRAHYYDSSRGRQHGGRAYYYNSSRGLQLAGVAFYHDSSRAAQRGGWALVAEDAKVRWEGGEQVRVRRPFTVEEWLDQYAVEVREGIAYLYKAVGEDFSSWQDVVYIPGTVPEAPDWDPGETECGGGLHFCARAWIALDFEPTASRFVCCPVQVADMVVHVMAEFPHKIKARRCCGPIVECGINGNPLLRADQAKP